jgi:hypothetical protein
MQRYRSHKIVEAGVITGLLHDAALPLDEVYVLIDGDERCLVKTDWVEYHHPQPGMILVRYAPDGYLSVSPAQAFEDGYTRIPSEDAMLAAVQAEPLLRYFSFSHLKGPLARVSSWFAITASHVASEVPRSAERTVALRKLLEGKDAAVRAMLPEEPRP